MGHKIKNGIVQGGSNGAVYAIKFLPKIQRELKEAVQSCGKDMSLARETAMNYITQACHGKTLAKLADEYNYVKYTKGYSAL